MFPRFYSSLFHILFSPLIFPKKFGIGGENRKKPTKQRVTGGVRLGAIRNKPRTAKVGAISKAQNLKGGPIGLCETPAGCKKF